MSKHVWGTKEVWSGPSWSHSVHGATFSPINCWYKRKLKMLLGEIAEAKGASCRGLRILRDLEETTTYISVAHPHPYPHPPPPPPWRLSPDDPESAPCRAHSYCFLHGSPTLCNVGSHHGFQAFPAFFLTLEWWRWILLDISTAFHWALSYWRGCWTFE